MMFEGGRGQGFAQPHVFGILASDELRRLLWLSLERMERFCPGITFDLE
jgi:hypothetical protein